MNSHLLQAFIEMTLLLVFYFLYEAGDLSSRRLINPGGLRPALVLALP